MIAKIFYVLWLLLLTPLLLRCGRSESLVSAAGLPDPFFGDNGVAIASLPGNETARAVALQSDGKILVVGHQFDGEKNQFLITRFTSEGKMDRSFGTGGVVKAASHRSPSIATGVIATADKIYVCGYVQEERAFTKPFLATLQADGRLGQMKIYEPPSKFMTVEGCALGKNGVVMVGGARVDGQTDFALLDSNGTFFSTDASGKNSDTASAVAIQEDGRPVLVGSGTIGGVGEGLFATRVQPSLSALDRTFDSAGTFSLGSLTRAEANAVAVNDKYIYIAGMLPSQTRPQTFVHRLRVGDGSSDETFGKHGSAFVDFETSAQRAYGIALQSDDRVIVVGEAIKDTSHSTFTVARFDRFGKLDFTFNGKGTSELSFRSNALNSAKAVLLQPDGKILVAGDTGGDIVVTRLTP